MSEILGTGVELFPESPEAPSDFELWEHQLSAGQVLVEARQLAEDRDEPAQMLLRMATGTGKTQVALEDIRLYREDNPEARVLYIAHREGIVKQAKQEFESQLEGVETGLLSGSVKDYHDKDLVFATFQSLGPRLGDDGEFAPDDFDYIVVDEAHHSGALTYGSTIKYFQPKVLLGLTATPNRLDDFDIRSIYGEEAYDLSLIEALHDGLLTKVDYRVRGDASLVKDVLFEDRQLTTADVNETTRKIRPHLQELAKDIQEQVEEKGIEPHGLVFVQTIDHAELLANFLPHAHTFHSDMSQEQRDEVRQRFDEGEIDYMIAVDQLNEGVDIPEANVVAFMRATDSETVYLQQLGRGLRKALGKEEVLILDYVMSAERLKFIERLMWNVATREMNGTNELPERSRAAREGAGVEHVLDRLQTSYMKFSVSNAQLKAMQMVDEVGDGLRERKEAFRQTDKETVFRYLHNLSRRNVQHPTRAELERQAKEGRGPNLNLITRDYEGKLYLALSELDPSSLIPPTPLELAGVTDTIKIILQDIIERHPLTESNETNFFVDSLAISNPFGDGDMSIVSMAAADEFALQYHDAESGMIRTVVIDTLGEITGLPENIATHKFAEQLRELRTNLQGDLSMDYPFYSNRDQESVNRFLEWYKFFPAPESRNQDATTEAERERLDRSFDYSNWRAERNRHFRDVHKGDFNRQIYRGLLLLSSMGGLPRQGADKNFSDDDPVFEMIRHSASNNFEFLLRNIDDPTGYGDPFVFFSGGGGVSDRYLAFGTISTRAGRRDVNLREAESLHDAIYGRLRQMFRKEYARDNHLIEYSKRVSELRDSLFDLPSAMFGSDDGPAELFNFGNKKDKLSDPALRGVLAGQGALGLVERNSSKSTLDMIMDYDGDNINHVNITIPPKPYPIGYAAIMQSVSMDDAVYGRQVDSRSTFWARNRYILRDDKKLIELNKKLEKAQEIVARAVET